MSNRLQAIFIGLVLAVSYSPVASAQFGQPEIVQEHWYHSYATLTLDVNEWADENPDIVRLVVAGQTELGRNLGFYRFLIGLRILTGWEPEE